MNPLYLSHLIFSEPQNITPQKELVHNLTNTLEDSHPIKKRLLNIENYGFKTIATNQCDEAQMVSQNLEKLFQKIDKNEITHIVHSSPTVVMGDQGGVIAGVGRYITEQHKLKNVSYIPLLSGCASIQPVFDVAKSLSMAHNNSKIVMIFSLHSSSCRKAVENNKKDIIEDIYQASPFVLFGDSVVSCVISGQQNNQGKSYEILDSIFEYDAQKWVAKAYIQDQVVMQLNGENQKNMLKEFLCKQLPFIQKKYGCELFFVHNQIPKVFNEIIAALGIPQEKAPEVVSKFGNLACQTSIVNMAVNEDIIKDGNILGLLSVGEHTGISESTIVLKAVFNN